MKKPIKTFERHGSVARIIKKTKKVMEHGYTEPSEVVEQHLQLRNEGWFNRLINGTWFTIDSEIVPTHAVISDGCFGDTGGWVSKFAERYPEAFS